MRIAFGNINCNHTVCIRSEGNSFTLERCSVVSCSKRVFCNRITLDRCRILKSTNLIFVIPDHVIVNAGLDRIVLNIRTLVAITAAIILDAVKNNTGGICGNFSRIDVILAIIFNESHSSARPTVVAIICHPVITAYICPQPVVLEVDGDRRLIRREDGGYHGHQHCSNDQQANDLLHNFSSFFRCIGCTFRAGSVLPSADNCPTDAYYMGNCNTLFPYWQGGFKKNLTYFSS